MVVRTSGLAVVVDAVVVVFCVVLSFIVASDLRLLDEGGPSSCGAIGDAMVGSAGTVLGCGALGGTVLPALVAAAVE